MFKNDYNILLRRFDKIMNKMYEFLKFIGENINFVEIY